MKRFSLAYVTRELHIEATIMYHSTLTRMAKSKTMTTTNAGEDME